MLATFLLPSVLFYRIRFPFLTIVRGKSEIRQNRIGAFNDAIGRRDIVNDRNYSIVATRYYSSSLSCVMRADIAHVYL